MLIGTADSPAAMAGAHHERGMRDSQPYSIEYCLAIVFNVNPISLI